MTTEKICPENGYHAYSVRMFAEGIGGFITSIRYGKTEQEVREHMYNHVLGYGDGLVSIVALD